MSEQSSNTEIRKSSVAIRRILVGYRHCGPDLYDSGLGVVPEQLSRMSTAFQRLDSACCVGLGVRFFVVRRALEVHLAPY